MNQHKFTGDLESFADYFMKDRRIIYNLLTSSKTVRVIYLFSYSLQQFTLLRTFRICWTLGQRDIIPISCLSSTRISNEYVTFTNCFTNLLLLVIYLPFHRIWEVKFKRLDVSWVNIPTNINSTEWLNICASTNSPQTNPSISSITDGWISWVPTVDSFAMVSCHILSP